MHLICPPKFCISIVFNFSWDGCNTQEKWKTKVKQNFGGAGVGGGGKSGALWEEMWKWRMDFWDPDHQCTWVVALSWLGWQNAAICMKLSIQAWWSSFIVSVYRSGMLALVQPPLPSEKKNRFLFYTQAPECGESIFRSIEKFWCLLCYAEKSLVISSRILERCFLRFYCRCRFLTVQNSFWTVAF